MVKFVTTMAQSELETMGAKLFESWEKFAQKLPLLVIVDDVSSITKSWNGVEFKQFNNPSYVGFVNEFKDNPQARGKLENKYEYRLDVVRFCHKIYAVGEGLKYLNKDDDLYIWWDADAFLTDKLTKQKLKTKLGPFNWLAASLGRKDWDHTETGFMAFNLKNPEALNFIKDMVRMYDSRQVFKMPRGRTDSFVYDIVADAYKKHKSQPFKNLSEGVPGNDVWPQTVLADFSTHLKGFEAKVKADIVPGEFKTATQPAAQQPQQVQVRNRYDQIYQLINFLKPTIITEIGVAQGDRAEEMVRYALKNNPRCVYFGFDLFEDITPEISEKEMNGKRVSPKEEVANRLRKIQQEHPGFFFTLYKGNTNETLPNFVDEDIEISNEDGLTITSKPSKSQFVFIDGGHSVETIRNDWSAFKNAPLVILDDYYEADPQGNRPDITKFGCNFLLPELKNAKVLPFGDPIVHGGITKLVASGELAEKIVINQNQQSKTPQTPQTPKSENTVNADGKNVQIKTRNSIPNEDLQRNVDYACQMMKKHSILEVQACELHERWAYLIGGAASYKKEKNLKQLRTAKENGGVVFSSKTAHDYLIDQGIVPWACLLLDPRPHVASKFTPHKDVLYFVASQCHPSVYDALIAAGVRMQVYHAEVAAGERDVIKKHFPNANMIAGGSTSQSRGITVLMHMGFFKFKLFGLDSSYPTMPEKVHGINQEKKAMEIEVTSKETGEKIGNRKFITDPELIAQINDMEHILKIFKHLKLDCQSEGLMAAMLDHWNKHKQTFEEAYKI